MPHPALVFYDDQCEVCQAGISWLRLLDRRGRTEAVPLDPDRLARAGVDPEAANRRLHVVEPGGRVHVGFDAVAWLARRFPATWLPGALGAVPPFRWLGRIVYDWVAANRYALSKCRGGACRVSRARPLDALWTCYGIGLLIRLPLTVAAIVRQVGRNLVRFLRCYRRRIDLLDGRLRVLVLNGLPCDLISLLLGEQFVAILYDGVFIDPGPPRLRPAVLRHLRRLPAGSVRAIAATHHHEEHAGNLNWIAGRTGAAIHVGEATARLLATPPRLPWIRRFMIGQAPALEAPFEILGGRLGALEVFPTPGHCDDHLVFYDRRARILFAGDAFMGAYFSAPNPDVDTRRWIDTLRRLLALEIDILVEGHGPIHTLRPEIPERCPLLVRQHPREQIREKLRFCEWLLAQVESGAAEGLPVRAVEVTCFPWGRRFAWENFLNDELSRLFSHGHWSRTELVRSFFRPPGSSAALPLVYEVRLHLGDPRVDSAAPHFNATSTREG